MGQHERAADGEGEEEEDEEEAEQVEEEEAEEDKESHSRSNLVDLTTNQEFLTCEPWSKLLI